MKYKYRSVTIITEQRPDDWIAYVEGDRAVWESGRDEAHALGKLIITLSAEGDRNV